MCLYIKTCLNVRKRDLLQLAQENGSYCKNTRGTYGRNDFTELLSSRSARNGHHRVILGLRAALKITTAQLENVHLFLLCFTVNITLLKNNICFFSLCYWLWLTNAHDFDSLWNFLPQFMVSFIFTCTDTEKVLLYCLFQIHVKSHQVIV